MPARSRRVLAGLDEESSDVSCGNDVGDVALDFCHCWLDVFSDHWPTHMNVRDLRRVFPSHRTAGVSSRICIVTNNSNSWMFSVASSFVCAFCWVSGHS